MDFTPTKTCDAGDKQRFAEQFIKFVKSGFQEKFFTNKFYYRLSCCFDHIAHYDRNGFYTTWFSSTKKQHDFLVNVVEHPCYGDPTCTYSDVERYLRDWVKNSGLVDEYRQKLNSEIEREERAQLAKLQEKYQ